MSLLVTLMADILVAVLLVATIVSCLRLSRRIAGLKADEAAMRQTIGDLIVATATAERAITGLRSALDECDRTLGEKLEAGGRVAAELGARIEAGGATVARIASGVQAGEGVIARIGAIVSQAQPVRAAAIREPEPTPRPRVVVPEPVLSNGERLSATLAAAQALSERALDRIRAKAA